MRITEIHKVAPNKIGRLNKNGIKPEPAEEQTFKYLTLFGFNIELIRPSSIEKMKNPDILISGATWEVKTPTSFRKNTIKNRFHEATKQATKIIFDLRYVEAKADEVEKQIITMFQGHGRVRHMMIIRKDGEIVDFIK